MELIFFIVDIFKFFIVYIDVVVNFVLDIVIFVYIRGVSIFIDI